MKMKIWTGGYSRTVQFGDGSFYEGKGKGLQRFWLDTDTGTLHTDGEPVPAANPSFLTLNRAGTLLYAVNELENYEGRACGAVSAFRVTAQGAVLLNTQPTFGTDPCHAALTPDERFLCVSNYGTGSECVFSLRADGALDRPVQLMQHTGHGADPVRQAGPHCHSISFAPDGNRAVVAELGTDRLLCYRVLPGEKPLVPAAVPSFSGVAGTGPRLCRFTADGGTVYAANELANTILVLKQDGAGVLRQQQVVSSLPEKTDLSNCALAEIALSPDGRFLYASNRGQNTLCWFAAEPGSGALHFAGWCPCGGKTPRHFELSPQGDWLLCANQDSDNIIVFARDVSTGTLRRCGETAVGSPTCVRFCPQTES
jgi:6-phosphogluconolactonase